MIWPVIALLSLATFWLALYILITKWPRTPNKSISQHSASSRHSYIYFTIVQSSVGFILWLFVLYWFAPHFKLGKPFIITYSIVAWLQIIVSFIPDRAKGKISEVHLFLANCFAIGMFLITILLCFAPTIHGISKVLFVLTLLYMAYGFYMLRNTKGRPHILPNYLYMQIVYIVSFQISFLFVSFFG